MHARRRENAGELEHAVTSDSFPVMSVMRSTPASPGFAPTGTGRPSASLRAALPRLPIRSMLVGSWLVIAASAAVQAGEHLQDWIPDVLTIPDDAEVVMDRAIGSSVRMLSIATAADLDTLFADWEENLASSGYFVTQGAEDVLVQSIEFSGPGIANAKIIVSPMTDDDRSIIKFDATLD